MKKINYVLVTILLILNTGCVNMSDKVKSDIERLNLSAKVLQEPRLAFFQIKNSFMHSCKVTEDVENPIQCEYSNAIASGTLIDSSISGFRILTAAHICKINDLEVITQSLSVVDLQQKEYPVKVVAIDTKKDMCILFAKDVVKIKPVQISKTLLTAADVVYNIAAPLGIFLENFVPIFDGRFVGSKDSNSWFVLYAQPGSSGSMILNHRGQLVGILTHVLTPSPVLTLPIARSPLLQDIIKFVESNKNNTNPVDLYKKQ